MGKDLNGKELGVGISQRKDGIYMGRYVDYYGKRKSLYSSDLKVIKKRLEKEKFRSSNGFLFDNEDITLSEWFDEYIQLYKVGRVKDVTVYRIHQTFSTCRKDPIGSMKLKDIRGVHVQKFINDLDAKDYSYGSLMMIKSLLNEMFKKAMGNNFMTINPCDAAVLPKKEKYEARYLTEKEQKMFLESARGYVHEDIFLANLAIGCRIGELLGLKWSDIDFENKTIHIRRTIHYAKVKKEEQCHFFFTTTKTECSDRVIPLLPEMEEILNRVKRKEMQNQRLYSSEWKQESPFEDMVFTTQKGAPIRYGDVLRTVKKVIVKANLYEEEMAKIENREPFVLKEFSPHCFRHSFITKARKLGIEYDTIRLYVGHSNKEMTQYYDHNKPKIDVESLKKINFLAV